jgi:hypothetical protein
MPVEPEHLDAQNAMLSMVFVRKAICYITNILFKCPVLSLFCKRILKCNDIPLYKISMYSKVYHNDEVL